MKNKKGFDKDFLHYILKFNDIENQADLKIINKLRKQEEATSKELQKECELSRTATLRRAERLIEAGILDMRKELFDKKNGGRPGFVFKISLEALVEIQKMTNSPGDSCDNMHKLILCLAQEIVQLKRDIANTGDRIDQIEKSLDGLSRDS
jgi:predicted transcriptional regulator